MTRVRRCTCGTELHGNTSHSDCMDCGGRSILARRRAALKRAKAANAADYAARGFSETRIIRNPAAYYGH